MPRINVSRELQPLKSPPIMDNNDGKLMDVREKQFSKVNPPLRVVTIGRLTLIREVQLKNARSPMDVIFGRYISLNEAQS